MERDTVLVIIPSGGGLIGLAANLLRVEISTRPGWFTYRPPNGGPGNLANYLDRDLAPPGAAPFFRTLFLCEVKKKG